MKSMKELEEELESCNINIIIDPKDHLAFYAKAHALTQMAEVAEKRYFYDQALENYNTAIKLSEAQNELSGMYLAERAALYITLDKKDLAITDIQRVLELPKESNFISAMHIKCTLKDLLIKQPLKSDKTMLIILEKSGSELAAELGILIVAEKCFSKSKRPRVGAFDATEANPELVIKPQSEMLLYKHAAFVSEDIVLECNEVLDDLSESDSENPRKKPRVQ